MKEKKINNKKENDSKKESLNGIGKEDELELDSLLNVEGGGTEDENTGSCGLGCFTGAIYKDEPSSNSFKKE